MAKLVRDRCWRESLSAEMEYEEKKEYIQTIKVRSVVQLVQCSQ